MAATKLNDFREQYPQYVDWSDDDLVTAIGEKFYPDVPLEELKRQVGMEPPEWADYPRDPAGFRIDPTRPEVKNGDDSISTEEQIGVNMDGREYNIPSIIDGKRVPIDQAVAHARQRMSEGWEYPNFDTMEEAEAAAKARSAAIRPARDEWKRRTSPSFWDRVKDAFTAEKVTPASVLSDKPPESFINDFTDPSEGSLPERSEQTPPTPPSPSWWSQLYAGVDEWMANRDMVDAWDNAETSRDAIDTAHGRLGGNAGPMGISPGQMLKQQRNARADAGDPLARRQIADEVKQQRAVLVKQLQENIDSAAARRQRSQSVPYSQSTQQALEAETFFDQPGDITPKEAFEGKQGTVPSRGALGLAAEHPIDFIAEVGIRSAPNMAESIPLAVAGALLAGAPGFGAALGFGSGMVEYRSALSEYLQKNKVDMSSAESVMAAVENRELMGKARDYALKRSGIIATVDAFTGGVAGRPLVPFLKTAYGRLLGESAAQATVQAAGGAGGEALAQAATLEEGESLRAGEILAEAAGELVTVPIEVGTASVTGVRAAYYQRKEAEFEAMLDARPDIWGGQPPIQGEPWRPRPRTPPPTPEPDTVKPEPPRGGEVVPTEPQPPPTEPPAPPPAPEGELIEPEPAPQPEARGFQLAVQDLADELASELPITDEAFSDAQAAYQELVSQGVEPRTAAIQALYDQDGLTEDEVGYLQDEQPTTIENLDFTLRGAEEGHPELEVRRGSVTLGGIQAYDQGDGTVQIQRSDLGRGLRGKQIGTRMYEEFIRQITGQGKQVASDQIVTEAAVRVWESLERKGYGVERNPNVTKEGVALEDSNYELHSTDNQPVFRITSVPAQEAAAVDLFAQTRERMQTVLASKTPKELAAILRGSGLTVGKNDTAERLIERAILAREAADVLSQYETVTDASEAVQSGEIDRAKVFEWWNAIRKGTQAENHEINYELNLQGIYRWAQLSGAFSTPREAEAEPEALTRAHRLLVDPRLKRDVFRGAIQNMASELIEGGGVSYTFDANGNINGRTPSQNPAWFQSMVENADMKMTVKQVQKAVDKAITGKKLGIRETRAIQNMLGTVSDMRTGDESINWARRELAEARQRRQEARDAVGLPEDPFAEIAGERFSEDEYDADMGADARIIFEGLSDASVAGLSDAEVESMAAAADDLNEFMNQLARAADEARSETGAPQMEAQPGGRAATDAAAREFAASLEDRYEADGLESLVLLIDPNGNLGIENIAVAPQRRNAFVGKHVMREVVAWADERGLTTLLEPAEEGSTYAEQQGTTSRASLVRFYSQFGFRDNRVANHPAYPPNDMFRPPGAKPAVAVEPAPVEEELGAEPEAPARPQLPPYERRPGQGKLTAIQADALEEARALVPPFTHSDLSTRPALGSQRTITVNTINALISKGYIEPVNPKATLFKQRFVVVGEEGEFIERRPPTVESPRGEYALPWKMSRRGDGDLYIARIGPNAGRVSRTRTGPNDLAISFNQEQLLPDFMFYVLQHLQPKIAARAKGVAQQAINQRDVDEVLLEHFSNQVRSNDQLDMFPTSAPVPTQADAPNLIQARTAAVEAVKQIQSMPGLLAMTLSMDFAARQRVSLVGQKINNTTDLAILAQLYRDPRFETFRMIFVDAQGEVISQLGITTRMPASSEAIIGPDIDAYLKVIADTAQQLGATGYYLQHNHPSGDSSASTADEGITKRIAAQLGGFLGHVIVDTDNYSVIRADGRTTKFNRRFLGQGEMREPTNYPAAAGLALVSSYATKQLAQGIEDTISPDAITLIVLDAQHKVIRLATLPHHKVTTRSATRRELMRIALADQGAQMVAIGRDRTLLDNVAPNVLDVIDIDETGRAHSRRERGLGSGGNVFDQKRTGRIAAGTSQAWEYLRPLSLEDRKTRRQRNRPAGIYEPTPDYPVRNPANNDAQTGQPFHVKLFRGSGRADQGAVYSSVAMPLLGRDVTYFAYDDQRARTFGPDVEERNVELENPLVIGSDDEFRAWHKKAGAPYYLNPFVPSDDPGGMAIVQDWSTRMLDAAKADGHDGVVLQWDNDALGDYSDENPSGWKYLRRVWAQPQVIVFESPPVGPRDLLGQDTTQQQLIANEIKRRDARRNAGTTEIETGQADDLFSEARKQQGLFDVESRTGKYSTDVPARATRVAGMSMTDLVDSVYTDALTGVGNRRAYDEEAANLPVQAIIDADSLKWINDNLGLEAGDAMLKAIAEALDQAEIEVYRIGGDEFAIGGDTKAEVEAALELARGILANQTVRAEKGESRGIAITWGIGDNKAGADSSLKAQKQAKEASGERAARGMAPPNTTLHVQASRPLNMQPGTNYVPMIGRYGALPIDANNNLVLGTGRTVRIPKDPVRREDILELMRRYYGNRIYQGRVKGRGVLGFYRPGQGELRIKAYNDIEVAAHEIAHYLDDRHPWIKKLYDQFRAELLSVSYDDKNIKEGWAEFMRLFLTQDSMAMDRAPGFYDAFLKLLEEYPTQEQMIYELQEVMHAWTMQGARARGASKMGPTNASPIEKFRRLFPNNVWQSALDGLRGIKKAEIAIGDTDEQVAYDKLRLALGGSNAMLEAVMFFGTPGWRADRQGIEFTGESLMDIFGESWGDHDMGMYMLARRARELIQQGREKLMRPDEIVAWIGYEGANPQAASMWDRYQAYNKRMLDFAEGAGVLGAEQRKAMEEMNKNYVPFYRVIESELDKRSVKVGGNPFMRLKGGTQNVAVIWDNIVQQNGLLIRFAMTNDGKRALLSKLARGHKMGSGTLNLAAGTLAAPIGSDTHPVMVDSTQVVRKVVEALGMTWGQYQMAKNGMVNSDEEAAMVDLIDSMIQGMSGMTQFFIHGQDPSGFVDYYLQDGVKKWFEIIDPGLWDSLQFLGPKGTNLALQFFGAFSATLRRGVVAVPVFQTLNFLRDTVNAWLLSTAVKVPAARALRVVFSRMNNDPMYQEMMINGGGFANRAQGLQNQRKLVIDPTRLTAMYDRFMGRFENANRLAEYKAERARGTGPRRAALLSRDISTDFAMRGSSEVARALAVSVPFLNARAQGLYRNKRQFDRAELAASYAMRGSAVMIATLALYALNKDDERYKELPEDVKDLYWVFFTGPAEDDYVLFPKPFESGMLWGTLPERIAEYTETENGKEFLDSILWMFMQTFNWDMTPQVFQPWIDIDRNKDWTGAPIVPFYLDNVEPSQQYQYYTSETTKAAGKALNLSPIKMDHMIRGYLGTMGTYALAASDALIRATTAPYMDPVTGELNEYGRFGEAPTRGETWRENIVVKAVADRLVNEGPPRRTKYVTDLYDMVREAEKVANTMALMMKRNVDEAEVYMNDPEHQYLFGLTGYGGGNGVQEPPLVAARKELRDIRIQMDNVRADPSLTGDEKRSQLWDLVRSRNELSRELVQEMTRAKAEIDAGQLQPDAALKRLSAIVDPGQPVAQAGAQ